MSRSFRVSVEEAARRGWLKPVPTTGAGVRTPKVPTVAPGAGRKRTKREIEGEEQAALIELFRKECPDIGHLLIHIPNGGSRKNAFEGWRLKKQGVRAGVSDLLLPVARGGFFGLWIEFKAAAPHDSPVSTEQKQWLAEMREQGYSACVCLGVDAAIAALRRYVQLPITVATLD